MALVQYIQACGATPLDSLRLFKELNDKLADPECMRRLQCQMGELAGGQEQGRRLDTMEQLQFVCHCGVVKAAGAAREQAANALSASQLLDVMLAAAEQLQQLEPTNPKSYPLADLSGSSAHSVRSCRSGGCRLLGWAGSNTATIGACSRLAWACGIRFSVSC